jgi:hypothetical protein
MYAYCNLDNIYFFPTHMYMYVMYVRMFVYY